jgi:hypothetical protein
MAPNGSAIHPGDHDPGFTFTSSSAWVHNRIHAPKPFVAILLLGKLPFSPVKFFLPRNSGEGFCWGQKSYGVRVTFGVFVVRYFTGVSVTTGEVVGGAWQAGTQVNLAINGTHIVDVRAADQAGNAVTQTSTVKLETSLPQISLNAPGTFCPACGSITIAYSVAGNTSGVAK